MSGNPKMKSILPRELIFLSLNLIITGAMYRCVDTVTAYHPPREGIRREESFASFVPAGVERLTTVAEQMSRLGGRARAMGEYVLVTRLSA
jgi:hypothetical protein